MLLSVAKARMRRIKMAAGVATALVALLALSPNPFAAQPTTNVSAVVADQAS